MFFSQASVDAAMCLINMNASEPSPKRTKVSSTKLHNSSMPSPLGRGAQRFPGNTNSNPKRSKANESKGPVGLVKPDSENKSHPKVRDPVASKPVVSCLRSNHVSILKTIAILGTFQCIETDGSHAGKSTTYETFCEKSSGFAVVHM